MLRVRWLSRYTARQSGRFAFSTVVSAGLGAVALVGARMVGAGDVESWLFAAGMTVVWFGYLLVYVNLHVLGYFPRPTERLVDRGLGVAVPALLAYLAVRTAPSATMAALACLTALGMAAHALSRGRRDLAEPLLAGAVYPRGSADARVMLTALRPLCERQLPAAARFHARLNTAHALVVLAGSEDSYRHLHEAYDILLELATAAGPGGPAHPAAADAPRRIQVTEALVEAASSLRDLGDDPGLYEQAALLLDRTLAEPAGEMPDVRFLRLVNLAGLHLARSGVPARLAGSEPVDADALGRAIRYLRRALPLAPPHRRAELHLHLALHLAIFAGETGDWSAGSEAIAQARRALGAIGWTNRELRPMVRLILADLLVQRFAGTADDDGDGAVSAADAAEAEGLAWSQRFAHEPVVRAYAWFVLARVRRICAAALDGGAPSGDTARILAAGRKAVATVPDSRARLRAATMMGWWAAEYGLAGDAASAFGEALATARRLSATGLVRRQQQAALYEIRGVAAECAHWLLAVGRVDDAVVVLESSRALVLGAAVNRELLVQRLRRQNPRLARRCAELSARLARVDPDRSVTGPELLIAVHRRRREADAVHQEWRRITGQLAALPEFRALLDPPRHHHITAAARRQPLVYLVAAQRTGYALIVEAAGRRVIELPDLRSAAVEELARRFRADAARLADTPHARTTWRATLTDGVDWLRTAAMGPLTAQLGYAGPVTLVPVGDLVLLPLHAAASSSDEAAAADDTDRAGEVIWSYAPSAQILGPAAEAAVERAAQRPGVLHVGAAGTGRATLRYTELVPSALRRHAGRVTALHAAGAQRSAVLEAARDHHVYHFACHGAADARDPLDSHLRLADGRLTVRDLLAQRLPARLAVLAACETGVPYAHLPDEAVSLPAALLEAGVPGVVGTLWPVEELPTLMLTTRFYDLWLGRRLPPATALHHAQRWLRTGVVEQFEAYLGDSVGDAVRWPYRSTGRGGQRRIFAHPDCWAAFTYTGV
jgi:hypothetical protein